MKVKYLLTTVLLNVTILVYSQEETFEPQKQVIGYVATEADYIKDIKGYSHNYGVSLAEAGLLVNYQPFKNFTFKTVFVYRPDLSVDQMFNEANVEYKVNKVLNIKAGRFLTPLSPINTYYYAAVNNSITLPMIITHHEFFPLNIDAVSVNGVWGNNFKLDYNVFAGGYQQTLWLKTGAMRFFGAEDDYFQRTGTSDFTINTDAVNSKLSFGKGIHLGCSYLEYVTLGLNVFTTSKEYLSLNLPLPTEQGEVITPVDFDMNTLTYGLNFKFKYSTFQFISEAWRNEVKIKNTDYNLSEKRNIDGAFAEISNTFNKITPYARFEYHNAANTKFNRITAGVNYKPIFETTYKLEYVRYQYKSTDLNGLVASFIYCF